MEKKYRLRKNMEFKKVYSVGKKIWNRNFILYIKKNKLDETRVGFTITKRHGNSVVRNKIRRRLKESYRLNFDNVKTGYDLVFIPKQNILDISYKELENSMVHIMKIAGVLKIR
ncbi:MAG: ribonuclease P protein component [Tissierellaceae bacterium]|nr:ribonuclease P protein component [Tissierellaceae bacterium]